MLLLWLLHIGTVVVFCNHNSLFLWSPRNTWLHSHVLEGNPCEPCVSGVMSFARNANPHIYQASACIWISIPKLSRRICWSIGFEGCRSKSWMYQPRIVVQWTEKWWTPWWNRPKNQGLEAILRSGEGEIFTKSTTWCTWSSAGSATVLWAKYGKMDIKTSTSILMVPHDPTV